MNKKLQKGLTTTMAMAMAMGVAIPATTVLAAATTNGWSMVSGQWHFYANGTMVKNTWKQDSSTRWFYLGADGAMVVNTWAQDSTGWCFLSADGSWVSGSAWKQDTHGWCYIQNGYWVNHAMYAQDSHGWQFVGANGYWDATVAPTAANPIATAETAVANAERTKLAADIATATTAVNAINNAIAEKAGFTARIAKIVPIVTTLQVSSVSAINGNTVQVTFNEAVDKTTAETETNFTAIKLADNTVTGFTFAELSADGKTVTLTSNTANLDIASDYVLSIKGLKVVNGTDLLNFAQTFKSVTDATAPVISSVSAKTGAATTSSVTVNFNESVDITGAKAPIFMVNGTVVSATQATDKRSFTVQLPSAVAAGTSLKVDVSNLYDLAGNKGTSTLTTVVASDLAAPSVTSVEAVSDTMLKVVFSKAIDASKLLGNFSVTADGMNDAATGIYADASLTALGANPTEAYITLAPGTIYTSTIKARNLNVTFKNLTDSLGNVASKDITNSISIAKDEVKPTVVSVTHNKLTAGTNNTSTFLIKLSEKSKVAGTLALNLVDKDGVLSTVSGNTSYVDSTGAVVSAATSSNYILVTLATNTLIANSDYKISVASGLFTDLATDPNTNVAATVNTSVIDGKTAADAVAPTVLTAATTAAGVLTVTYDKAVSISGTIATNYKLNNVALPANTSITLNMAKTVATITLPTGFVTKDITAPVLTVSGVLSTDGGQIGSISKTVTGGTILETVAPVLTKAEFVASKQIKLTFNEASGLTTGKTITIYDGSTPVGTSATTAGTLVDGVITETVTVTGATFDTLNQSALKVKIADGDLIDTNANVTTGDSVVALNDEFTSTVGTLGATYTAGTTTFQANLASTPAVEAGSTAYLYVVKATDAAVTADNYTQFNAIATQSATNLIPAAGISFVTTVDSLGAPIGTFTTGTTHKVYVVIKDASGNIVVLNAAVV